MRVLLTSTGLETDIIKERFLSMLHKEVSDVKAVFIPTAAIDAGAIEVLPKCMNDLLKCGIQEKNIFVYDLHFGMKLDELKKYDVVYLCGGSTGYLLERLNDSGFGETLMEYIHTNGIVIGVSAGSLIFSNNLKNNLGLLNTKMEVHCIEGDMIGKLCVPLNERIRLTNASALVIADDMEIIGD